MCVPIMSRGQKCNPLSVIALVLYNNVSACVCCVLRRNIINIYGEPITQATCKLCAIMPVNVCKSIQQKVKVKTDFVLTVHILSEVTRG